MTRSLTIEMMLATLNRQNTSEDTALDGRLEVKQQDDHCTCNASLPLIFATLQYPSSTYKVTIELLRYADALHSEMHRTPKASRRDTGAEAPQLHLATKCWPLSKNVWYMLRVCDLGV